MYVLNEKTIPNDNNQEIKSYGISYEGIIIEDISTNKEKIEKLIILSNELDLSPIHIYDVIDDFLVDFEI